MVTFAEAYDTHSGDEIFCPHCGKWDIEFPETEMDCTRDFVDITCPECGGKIEVEAYYKVLTDFEVRKAKT